MAKTTAIAQRFGISVALRSEVDSDTLLRMERLLKEQLNNVDKPLPPNAEIYVKQLRISSRPVHFGVADVVNRIETLSVTASLPADAGKSGKIEIFDLGFQSVLNISVARSRSRIVFSLPGSYIASHDEYTDYIAVVVKPGCQRKLKRLNVRITAQATPDFSRRLRNNPDGRVVSTLTFQLGRNVQLALDL